MYICAWGGYIDLFMYFMHIYRSLLMCDLSVLKTGFEVVSHAHCCK